MSAFAAKFGLAISLVQQGAKPAVRRPGIGVQSFVGAGTGGGSVGPPPPPGDPGNVQVDQTGDPGNVQVDQTTDPGNVQTDQG